MEILKKRIAFLDVLKAFAIFLVVWGIPCKISLQIGRIGNMTLVCR